MASLVEELVQVLEEESNIYEALLPVLDQKTETIIQNDLQGLQQITEKEQLAVDQILSLEGKREGVMQNIKIVLNYTKNTMTMQDLLSFLPNAEKEKERLQKVYEKLKMQMQKIAGKNQENKQLLEISLEMIAFQINAIQSMRTLSPDYCYGDNAKMLESKQPSQTRTFDLKQ